MTKVQQSESELIQHLHEHMGFLESSCSSFDQGSTGEAKRLAVTLRVLLHDTTHSESLLGQLRWKSGDSFLDSAIPYNPGSSLSHHGLVAFRLSGEGASYHAPLEDGVPSRPYEFMPFSVWWNSTVICDNKRNTFDRRELILTLCNKDGGAHVDRNLDQKYVDLSRSNSVGWVYESTSGSIPITEVERHSVRQISFEIIVSVKGLLQKHGFE
jgi:hypothetical protein